MACPLFIPPSTSHTHTPPLVTADEWGAYQPSSCAAFSLVVYTPVMAKNTNRHSRIIYISRRERERVSSGSTYFSNLSRNDKLMRFFYYAMRILKEISGRFVLFPRLYSKFIPLCTVVASVVKCRHVCSRTCTSTLPLQRGLLHGSFLNVTSCVPPCSADITYNSIELRLLYIGLASTCMPSPTSDPRWSRERRSARPLSGLINELVPQPSAGGPLVPGSSLFFISGTLPIFALKSVEPTAVEVRPAVYTNIRV